MRSSRLLVSSLLSSRSRPTRMCPTLHFLQRLRNALSALQETLASESQPMVVRCIVEYNDFLLIIEYRDYLPLAGSDSGKPKLLLLVDGFLSQPVDISSSLAVCWFALDHFACREIPAVGSSLMVKDCAPGLPQPVMSLEQPTFVANTDRSHVTQGPHLDIARTTIVSGPFPRVRSKPSRTFPSPRRGSIKTRSYEPY